MGGAAKDLTRGPLARQIWLFSLPLMASNLLQVLFNMADVAVVGRFAGPTALGSVGSTTTLVALFTGILIGLSGGINVLVALAVGADNRRDVEETVHTALIISGSIGALLLAAGALFAPDILVLLHTKEELLPGAVSYLRIYLLGLPALAVYNFGNAVLSSVGDTKSPLRYLSIAGVLNVALNLFFVLVCRLDVQGVAIASIISQYTSAFLILRHLFACGEVYGLRREKLHLSGDKAVRILRLGVPSGLQNAIFYVANLFVQMGVNSFDATVVAGNSAAANADNLVYDMMAAFYTACGSFMGQNYGAKRKERVGLHGLLHRGCQKSWKESGADAHCHLRSLYLPGDMDLHGVCLFWHNCLPVSSVCVFLGSHRHRGQSLSGEGIQGKDADSFTVSFYLQGFETMVNYYI